MPVPPRVSVIALRTADLAQSTAFYVALGWELSPASTAAMSLFKTAGSLLLVCTDKLLVDLGGPEVAAALAGEPSCPFTWPPTARSTPRSRRQSEPVASWSGGPLLLRWVGPMGSSRIPMGMCGRSSTTRSTSWRPTDGPKFHRLDLLERPGRDLRGVVELRRA
jgi:catechol 2,3-dioxygenase-like lactoylglutathione lyase family enzyme